MLLELHQKESRLLVITSCNVDLSIEFYFYLDEKITNIEKVIVNEQ